MPVAGRWTRTAAARGRWDEAAHSPPCMLPRTAAPRAGAPARPQLQQRLGLARLGPNSSPLVLCGALATAGPSQGPVQQAAAGSGQHADALDRRLRHACATTSPPTQLAVGEGWQPQHCHTATRSPHKKSCMPIGGRLWQAAPPRARRPAPNAASSSQQELPACSPPPRARCTSAAQPMASLACRALKLRASHANGPRQLKGRTR